MMIPNFSKILQINVHLRDYFSEIEIINQLYAEDVDVMYIIIHGEFDNGPST